MKNKYVVESTKATSKKAIGIKDTFEEAKALMLEKMEDKNLCSTLSIHKRKVYTIKCHSRFGGIKLKEGCMEELLSYYSNLLSWWHYSTPKTINKLVDALNYCVREQQGACYNRDYYEVGE